MVATPSPVQASGTPDPGPRTPDSGPIPVIFVLGATASGKSALAVALARQFGGEVISADAMAVYRGMDIGTAKPTPAERQEVPHHLIDWLEPEDRCDVQRWFTAADACLRDIHARGHLPVVAGGSPLFTKALWEGLSAGAPRDEALRARLEARHAAEGGEALLAELARVDPTYAAQRHANDCRRIVRALEVWTLTGKPYSSFHTTDGGQRPDLAPVKIGLEWPREELYRRIGVRVDRMFAAGLVEEVRRLRGRLSPEAAQAVGYKELSDHLDGQGTLDEARARIAQGTRHLAKHQATWYRRFTDITWLPGDAPDLLDRAAALVAQAHHPPAKVDVRNR